MTSLLLLGAGGHSRVVAETALATGCFSRIAFLDDTFSELSDVPDQLGWPVLGPFAAAFTPQIYKEFSLALVAIGNGSLRMKWLLRLSAAGYKLPILIHPTATISPSAQIASGSVVFAQSVVQAQVLIGHGSILNTSCSVDHDAQLGDGVHICPGARIAGDVQVGDRSWIGIGSSVIQQIRIGSDVTVGAGAAVVCDLPDGATAYGVPARVLPSS